MSDFDMYILPLLCNQNENYYCWSSMIMSSYFNVFAPKNDKMILDTILSGFAKLCTWKY